MHTRHLTLGLLLALFGLSLVACKDDEVHDPIVLSCNMDNDGDALVGEWTLHAAGKRTECTDRRWQGGLDIDTTMPITVDAIEQNTSGTDVDTDVPKGQEATAFLHRIELADFKLSTVDSIHEFDLSGTSLGSCVNFTMRENKDTKDETFYVFEGQISDSTYVEGNFHGEGPKGCKSEGTFSIDIR